MKKFFSTMLLLLPLTLMMCACSDDDDDDVPNVGISCTISGGVFSDDAIYVAQGTALKVDGLTLVNHTDQDGAIGAVNYYWDHYLIGTNPTPPYELVLETADLAVGRHLLQAQMPIYVVDYPICWGYVQYDVVVVADASQLPGGGETSRQVTGIIKLRE